MSSPAAQHRLRDALLLAFVAWHLFATVVSILKPTPVGDWLYDHITRPYERHLKIRQSWKMFGNVPTTVRWLEVRRIVDQPGGAVALDTWTPLTGEIEREGFSWNYDRAHKLERHLKPGGSHDMRVSILEHACREPHDGVSPDMVGIVFIRQPFDELGAYDLSKERKEEKMETLRCEEVVSTEGGAP